MTLIPKIENYDVNVLAALGERTENSVTRTKIKLIIIDKIIEFDRPMFFLINAFNRATGILKESYAEVITIKMKDTDYLLEDSMIDEIVRLLSLDTLMYYGAESVCSLFSSKCVCEFWKRADFIEDKTEMIKKGRRKKNKLMRKLMLNRKGDRNDKY